MLPPSSPSSSSAPMSSSFNIVSSSTPMVSSIPIPVPSDAPTVTPGLAALCLSRSGAQPPAATASAIAPCARGFCGCVWALASPCDRRYCWFFCSAGVALLRNGAEGRFAMAVCFLRVRWGCAACIAAAEGLPGCLHAGDASPVSGWPWFLLPKDAGRRPAPLRPIKLLLVGMFFNRSGAIFHGYGSGLG
ncbi:hypothetical protein ZWY2020_002928 [Hordeum vulgare]|nr:hypothetical protein ZWY2020_002928 [Hordeum vulgare]